VRKKLAAQRAQLKVQLDKEKQAAQESVNASISQAKAQGKTLYKYKVVATGSNTVWKPVTTEATSEAEAIGYAKKVLDPRNSYPDLTYKATRV
jgi:hypothetical protein